MQGFNDFHINLCCWMHWFLIFESPDQAIKDVMYSQTQARNTGILLCPNCLANKIKRHD